MSAPAWATPGNTESTIPPATSPHEIPLSSVAGGTVTVRGNTYESTASGKNCVQRTLSVLNMVVSGLMVMTAVFQILESGFDYDILQETFVSVYMILFASLLFGYEFMWWMGIPWVNKMIRKNFGFLYGVKGKAAFIVFVAFLNFGLEGAEGELQGTKMKLREFSIILGVAMLALGVIHFIVWFKYEYFTNYQAPTAGLTPTSNDATEAV